MEGEAGAAQVSQEGGPAIRALGSRFKVSEVFLLENSEGSLQRNPSPIAENDGLTDERRLSQRFTEVGADVGSHTGVLLSSEEMELTKQMSALGLPIAFSTNQEKRNVKAKVRRKGSRGQLVGCLADNEYFKDDISADFLDGKTSGNKTQEGAVCNEKVYDDMAILDNDIQNSCISISLECSHTQSPCCIDESCEAGLDVNGYNDFDEWSVFWDEYYGRNYFFNSTTNISTWHPPPGLMQYAAMEENASLNLEDLHKESSVYPFFDIQGNQKSLGHTINPLESEEACKSSLHLDSLILNVGQQNVSENLDRMSNSLITETTTLLGDRPHDLIPMNPPREEIYCKEACSSREPMDDSLNSYFVKHRKKKSRKRLQKNAFDVVKESSSELFEEEFSAITYKYWCQRYLLFSKFNEGIKMDEEGWFSVTPELIAEHHALKCSGGTIIDCFAGVGGNAIQFAMRCDHVVAIDIDQQKVEHARHNAKIYGVDENIDFVKGDFFCLAPKLKGDVVYLSPPWGGPEYSKVDTYDLRTMLKPQNGYVLFKVAMEIAPRVVMFLPRNVDLNQLAEISLQVNPPWTLEVERNYLNGKLKAITAYFTKPS